MLGSDDLSPLSPDTASKLDVLGHYGHPLGMNGCQVGVLKEANQVSLSSLLQSEDCAGLETEVSLEVLGNLTNQALEGQLANEQLCGLLVLADLTKGDSSWPVPADEEACIRYLHKKVFRCKFAEGTRLKIK